MRRILRSGPGLAVATICAVAILSAIWALALEELVWSMLGLTARPLSSSHLAGFLIASSFIAAIGACGPIFLLHRSQRRTEAAERRARASERRFRDFAEQTSDWLWEIDENHCYTWFSGNIEQETGMSPDWLMGKCRDDIWGEGSDPEAWRSHLESLRRHEPIRDFIMRREGPEGCTWVRTSGMPVFDDKGRFCGYRGVGSNITAAIKAENEKYAAQVRLATAIDSLSEIFALYDSEDRMVICNEKFCNLNASVLEATQPGVLYEDHLRAGLALGNYPEAIGREDAWLQERLDRHRAPGQPFELARQDGRWLLINEQRMPDGGLAIIAADITAQKQAEAALRHARDDLERRVEERTLELEESESRFRDYAESTADWFWEMDAQLRFTFISENIERIMGVAPEWHYGKTRADILGPGYDPDIWEAHLLTLKARLPFRDFQYERVGKGVETRWLRVSGAPVFDRTGAFRGYRGTGTDITEQVRAEAKLHASEAQLRQAQKMQAVGQLTGGVAHDFNNLLAVIMGNADLLAERFGEGDKHFDAILRAAERGSDLTQHLLAFSRQQPLNPTAIDIDELTASMSDMLARALGETIKVDVAAAFGLWPAFADPGLVENALLNLGLNARDAMPDGGKLSIACANAYLTEADAAMNVDLQPGAYVQIAVSDEGCGMSAETLAQAFEPFFTTKPVGQGTGLGLAMVYGFAKQSGGHVSISTQLGAGTTVSIFLPRAEIEAAATTDTAAIATPQGRGERVLVIEDADDVRELTVLMLESLNYQVSAVADAASGHRALAEGGPVDLVLSDVILGGGATGLDFAQAARAIRPDLKIVFMSGYSPDIAKRDGAVDPDQILLAKPFRKQALALALRTELERAPRPASKAAPPPAPTALAAEQVHARAFGSDTIERR